MKKYFEIEINDGAMLHPEMIEFAMQKTLGWDDFSVCELPDLEEREKLLEDAKELMHGWIARKPNTRCTHDWLTRYAALKEGK